MDWIRRLERHFGRFAIVGLINWLVAGQVLVFGIMFLFDAQFSAKLMFFRPAILNGQVWRLITFLFIPENTSILWFALSAYFYYIVGIQLERIWGAFRLNIYVLLGWLGAVLSGLLLGITSNGFLLLSLWFAVAMLYPDREILLMGVMPVKISWLAIFSGVMWLSQFFSTIMIGKCSMILSMAGFFIFFGKDLYTYIAAKVRRAIWKYKNKKNWH